MDKVRRPAMIESIKDEISLVDDLSPSSLLRRLSLYRSSTAPLSGQPWTVVRNLDVTINKDFSHEGSDWQAGAVVLLFVALDTIHSSIPHLRRWRRRWFVVSSTSQLPSGCISEHVFAWLAGMSSASVSLQLRPDTSSRFLVD